MKIVVSDEAVADLERLRSFLLERNPKAAARAADTLAKAIDSLGFLPERGSPSAVPGWRELIVRFGRSACVIRYAYRASRRTAYIIRIWHSREGNR